ncbi:MAG: GNAT family N-acetyltransferase, partial [Rhodothermales bacterium]|nr:GNAT family N-acetyltransferase [Rhodothermales bacterium]
FPFTEEDAVEWISNKQSDPRGYSFGIFLKPDLELIGQVGLLEIEWDNRLAELGFFLGKDYWGCGYVTEAAERVVDFGFGEMSLNRIGAHHLSWNAASGRVLMKLGMTREGTLRQRIKKNDVYEDIVVYGILAQDYSGGSRSAEQ